MSGNLSDTRFLKFYLLIFVPFCDPIRVTLLPAYSPRIDLSDLPLSVTLTSVLLSILFLDLPFLYIRDDPFVSAAVCLCQKSAHGLNSSLNMLCILCELLK